MSLRVDPASEADAPSLVALRNAAAEQLTAQHGRGHWSTLVSEKSVLRAIAGSRVLVAREGDSAVGTLRLVTKKPWAIDPSYFRPVSKALYLIDMAVTPSAQRRGIGRALLVAARGAAAAWPSEAIRLDAYDAEAGAGGFYARCGFREVGRVVYRGTPLKYYEMIL